MTAVLRPLPSPPPTSGTIGSPSALWSSPPLPFAMALSDDALPKRSLPEIPLGAGDHEFPASWPPPIASLPAVAEPTESYAQPVQSFTPAPVSIREPGPVDTLASKLDPIAKETPLAEPVVEFNDDDLREAFGPIIEQAVRSAVYARENGIDTYLEPMLRSTIRRALAEYTPTQRPFQAPGAVDRFLWRLQALFTSRTYEDIIFEKTHRFQVEEVFLLDASSLALISFASSHPGRHSSAKRVEGTVQRLALQLRGADGRIRPEFELPEHRTAASWKGSVAILAAVVRGRSNELVLADLEFALKRIEDRFRERLVPGGPPLMKDIQPFLEDCLLIQAPASAA